MNDHSRIEALLDAALERDAAERDAFLITQCAGDDELLANVRRMLAAHDAAGSAFLENNALQDDPPLSPELERQLAALKPEEAGDVIGRYKLLQEIGEGGFGVVWMAEQEEPVRRRVALKIIKLGMDTREVIARFEQERQALAMMDHPNIARVFDAGATQFGRPYFVMELVRGKRITDFCDEAALGTRERLALFMQACHAVQHAHQKGIIHRDIKPSNILVAMHDDAPVPKVIDFGVAKATQQPLTDKTLFTRFEQMVGTPLYMSPEQAGGELDIDTRADTYALGVLPLSRTANGPEHPFTLMAMENLAKSQAEAGRREEAMKLRKEVLPLSRKVRGPEHPDTLWAMHNLAHSYFKAGHTEDALGIQKELLQLRRRVSGMEDRETLGAMTNLAIYLKEAQHLPEAIALQEESLAIKRRVLPPSDPYLEVALGNMAHLYLQTRRIDEANKLMDEVEALRKKK